MAEITGWALSVDSSDPPRLVSAAFDWPARAQDEPRQARQEWAEQGTALLPLGTRFNAVCLPARLVYTAIGADDPDMRPRIVGDLCPVPSVAALVHIARDVLRSGAE
ncbi:hypothetical protein AB0N81_19925 [Streptomyces sp. NPDC093510]|uniref:hypothetical protein n=1 Tax=Streptomyces sp. NPDC093510 TaxID=3155199 RepID=UPI0034343C7A